MGNGPTEEFYTIGISSPVLIIVVLLVCSILIGLVIGQMMLNRKLKKFTKTSGELNIEDILISNQKAIKALTARQSETDKHLTLIYENLKITYEKYAMHKYNAFDGMGGNLSSVIVMMNKNLDGFLMNVINTREGSQVYTKEIVKGKTEQALSNEEVEAIKIAVER